MVVMFSYYTTLQESFALIIHPFYDIITLGTYFYKLFIPLYIVPPRRPA